jgi:hypothetical protein
MLQNYIKYFELQTIIVCCKYQPHLISIVQPIKIGA